MQARAKPFRAAKARKLLGALIAAAGTLLLLQNVMNPPTIDQPAAEAQGAPGDSAISHTHRDAPAPAPVSLISA